MVCQRLRWFTMVYQWFTDSFASIYNGLQWFTTQPVYMLLSPWPAAPDWSPPFSLGSDEWYQTDLTVQTLTSNLRNSPNYLKLTSNLRRTNAINKPTWKLTSLTIWNFPFHLNQISSQTSLANLTSLVMHVYGMFTARLLLTQLLVVLIVLMSNAGSSEEAMHT